MADCDKLVGAGAVAYPCNLHPGHDGPCVARENEPSKRRRADWERANTTYVSTSTPIAPPPGPRVPGALEALGMQGPPKTSVDALTALEGRESRREHPEAKRRRLAGEVPEASIEERLVTHAGGVSVEEMQSLGLGNPIDPYTRKEVPYQHRTETPTPTWELPHPSFLDATTVEEEDLPVEEDAPITQGERVLQLVVEAYAALNEIARIVSEG